MSAKSLLCVVINLDNEAVMTRTHPASAASLSQAKTSIDRYVHKNSRALTMSQTDSELSEVQRLRAENEQLRARLALSSSANEPGFDPSLSDFRLCATKAARHDRGGAVPRSAQSGIIVPTRSRQPVSRRCGPSVTLCFSNANTVVRIGTKTQVNR